MQLPPCLQLALVKVLEGYFLPAGVTCVFFVFLHRKRGIEVVQVSTVPSPLCRWKGPAALSLPPPEESGRLASLHLLLF